MEKILEWEKFLTSYDQQGIPADQRQYYHGIQEKRLEEFLKTGKIPDAEQAFGGHFSITDDYGLATQYSGEKGQIIPIKLKAGTSIIEGDVFDPEFIREGDLTDSGDGEFLVNNPDCLVYSI